jgi:hypothetical protein
MTAQLDDEIGVLAGHLHAATASFVDMATAFDEAQRWAGEGMRSCAHWLTIATGIDLGNAREMLRVGHALRVLPHIHDAFATGQLSFDKVRALCWVARPDDEALWVELALEASGSQLATICRQFRRSIAVDDPERAALQRAQRRVVSWWLDEDGMLALYATLPPEEGRLVMAAIEAAVRRPVPSDPLPSVAAAWDVGSGVVVTGADAVGGTDADVVDPVDDPCAEEPPDHPHGALRADALVRICEQWLHGAASAADGAAGGTELVVHVDADTLSGLDAGGRCHLEGGPAISVAAARRIGCDATVVTALERDGVPLDVGRSRRVVSGRMRRLLQLRDQGCRYPGCTVPAADTEGHHVVHWVDGGRTDMANLVSLCRFHHHRHHEDAFRIVAAEGAGTRGGGFRFETADGRPIAVRATGVESGSPAGMVWLREMPHVHAATITATTPAARSAGERFDHDYAIVVLAGNRANAPPWPDTPG